MIIKSPICSFIKHSLTASLLLISSASVFATQENIDGLPIRINSDQQQLSIQENKAIFTGSVIVTRGEMRIEADKVVITRSNGQEGKEIVEAFGNPVRFSSLLENNKIVKGHSQKLRYDLEKDLVTLTDNAYLEQEDSNIKGEVITYLVKEQQISAVGDKGSRVNTTIIPSQLNSSDKK